MMKPIVKLVDKLDRKEIQNWENFLLENDGGNILQSSLMGEVFESTGFDWNLVVGKQNDSIIGGALSTIWPGGKFKVLNRFSTFKTTYGPIVVEREDKEKVALEILKKIEQIILQRGGMKHIVLSKDGWLCNGIEHLGYGIVPKVVGCTFIINLRLSEDELWRNLNKGFKRCVKSAEKYNIEIKEAQSDDSPLIMHKLNVDMSRRLKIPPDPLSYLESIWNNLCRKGFAKFFFAYFQGKPVAGSIILLYKKDIFAYSTFVRKSAIALNPNQMLKWFVIQWGKEHGYDFLDLLFAPSGTCRGNPTWGLYFFKKTLGGKEIPVYYYEKDYSVKKVLLWNKLVIPVYNRIMSASEVF